MSLTNPCEKRLGNISLIQIKEWRNTGHSISEEMVKYEWDYRKKICSKCISSKQKELKCFKVNNFVGGLQETYCSKLENARTKKFSSKIEIFFDEYPLR